MKELVGLELRRPFTPQKEMSPATRPGCRCAGYAKKDRTRQHFVSAPTELRINRNYSTAMIFRSFEEMQLRRIRQKIGSRGQSRQVMENRDV
jgi:hypothetical protein